MAKKFVAVLLLCIVVVAATMCVQQAHAGDDGQRYKTCFESCEKECKAGGATNSHCEVKCDEDCMTKEAAAKLNTKI